MKAIITLICICLAASVRGETTTFEQLAGVNKCWKEQKDIRQDALPAWQAHSPQGWIQLHLSLVEQTLRSRSTASLTKAQRARRLLCLDNLHAYQQSDRFPQNTDYTYRTPIFIDRQDNFCAVGYLLKTSGEEELARMIAGRTNLAYVRDMHYPELDAWAAAHGFTRDELAWIQPGYPPAEFAAPIGRGVAGAVHELFPDGDTLYVGGDFTRVDSTIAAGNIAYVTERGGVYTWHAMDKGVDGPVYAITRFNNRIYIAGHFSMAGDSAVQNVACWEGGRWHYAGCTFGEVRDLAVFKGDLYAAGRFDVCAAVAEVNFARLNGQYWQQIPGLSGWVNTLEVLDSVLVLGGRFAYGGDTVHAIRWKDNGFASFDADIPYEVNDFELVSGALYAGCTGSNPYDRGGLLWRLYQNSWDTALLNVWSFFSATGNQISINTLCREGASYMAGGIFHYSPLNGHSASNCIRATTGSLPGGNGDWFVVGGTIHKMIHFKNDLIAGGSFAYGTGYSPTTSFRMSIPLNSICKRFVQSVGVAEIRHIPARIYPNPVRRGNVLIIENNSGAAQFTLTDVTGRILQTVPLSDAPRQEVRLPGAAAGLYLMHIRSGRKTYTDKLLIE